MNLKLLKITNNCFIAISTYCMLSVVCFISSTIYTFYTSCTSYASEEAYASEESFIPIKEIKEFKMKVKDLSSNPQKCYSDNQNIYEIPGAKIKELSKVATSLFNETVVKMCYMGKNGVGSKKDRGECPYILKNLNAIANVDLDSKELEKIRSEKLVEIKKDFELRCDRARDILFYGKGLNKLNFFEKQYWNVLMRTSVGAGEIKSNLMARYFRGVVLSNPLLIDTLPIGRPISSSLPSYDQMTNSEKAKRIIGLATLPLSLPFGLLALGPLNAVFSAEKIYDYSIKRKMPKETFPVDGAASKLSKELKKVVNKHYTSVDLPQYENKK
ncbi:MAG: hypothetical protein HQK49_13655 [Oligoflexia bacterium]|nr:hypothetical protein [Oligoflexia bacterium]